jgi:glutamate 5-kinase
VETIVVKLGSSIVADERGEARADVLHDVCREVVRAYRAGAQVVIVSSGAIARGMRLMELPARPSAMDELQAASAVGQGRVYRVYDELLAAHGIRSAQVLLTFFDVSARSHYLNARQTLARLLDWRVVPVINENDTTTTDDISFGDNDFLAAQVAILVGATRLVLLSDVDGLYSANPHEHASAELIGEVRDFARLREVEIGVGTSPLGSGGMRSKVVAAEMATAAGIPTTIANGLVREVVARAIAGEPAGTRFLPQPGRRVSSFKLWLRYAKPTRGRVVVDAGAERALRERGTSLLPVGVVAVEGEFEAGDAVEVVAGDGGGPIGKGISNFSSGELRQVKGMQTADVRELVARASEEAVHRDYFVLS